MTEKDFEKPRQSFSSDCSPLLGSYADIMWKNLVPKQLEGAEISDTGENLNTSTRSTTTTDEEEVEEARAKKQKKTKDRIQHIIITPPSKNSL